MRPEATQGDGIHHRGLYGGGDAGRSLAHGLNTSQHLRATLGALCQDLSALGQCYLKPSEMRQ